LTITNITNNKTEAWGPTEQNIDGNEVKKMREKLTSENNRSFSFTALKTFTSLLGEIDDKDTGV